MRLSLPLLAKELREARWKWIVGGGALLVTMLTLCLMFDFLSSMAAEGIPLPEPWASQVLRQMRDYGVYAWLNWYGKNLYQIVLVIAVILGSAPLTGERSLGTLEFLLSQPLGRRCIFITKFTGGLLVLWLLVVLSTLAVGPCSWLAGHTLDLGGFLRGLPVSLGAAALFYSITFLFSAILRSEPLKVALVSGVTSAGLLALGSIPALRDISLARHLAAAGTLEGGPIRWDVSLLLLAASLACALAAERMFRNWNLN